MDKPQTMATSAGCVFLCMFALIIHSTSSLEFRIVEELPAGTEVGRIMLSNHQRLVLTNHQDLFQVEPSTGRVSTRRKLDRENLAKELFELIVVDQRDGQHGLPQTVRVFLTDINDSPPHFLEPFVSITFLETDQIGQQYLLDTAVDQDGAANGIIRQYAIVSGNEEGKFRLRLTQASADSSKNHFLHIENTAILDRETRDSYLLKISATDNGSPSLTGYFLLNITIGDVNDVNPVFFPSEYIAALSETAPENSVVLKVHATDNDDVGSNSLVSYSLTNDTQFSIDEEGVIRTTRNKTQCPRSKCEQSDCPRTCVLTVQARDHAVPSLTGRAYVYISLIEDMFNAPRIYFRYYPSASPYATVAEDAPNGTIVAVVSVKDSDDGINGKVDIFITNGNQDHQFRLEAASISSQGSLSSSVARMQLAYLRVNGQFDRQRLTSYNLTITAVDNGHPSLNSSKCLIVHVNLVNRYSPVFQSEKYESHLNEDVPVGSYVHAVMASDADGDGINGQILYSIVSGNDLGWFVINQDTGLVTTSQLLDRQKVESPIHLNISARDAAPGPRIAYTTLMVSIEDVNDHKPRFTNCPEEVNLRENAPLGTLVHHFMAVDEDFGENGIVCYELSGSSAASFSIDKKTGQLITRLQLDREKQPVHNLMVIARDNAGHQSQSSSCLVTVRLADEKDTRPIFYPIYYMVPVQNKLAAGQTITQVKATDADRNDLIRYAVAYSSHNGIKVHERTGQVLTTMPISLAPGDLAKIQISVTDAFGLTSQPPATIYLFTSDSVENSAFKFESANSYKFEVQENSANLTVGTVRLKTFDKWNGVEYFITDGDSDGIFSYDAKTGILRTVRAVDREETASYHLKLSAWMSPYYASTSIDIAVKDVADSAPVITSFKDVKVGKMDIPCSWPLGQAIVQISADDADMGVNGQLAIAFLHYDQTSPFSINSPSGVITLVRPLNCYSLSTIKTTVVVTDGANQTGTNEIHFRVAPDTSCRIFFERRHVVISVSEDQLVNSRLLTLAVKQCESPVQYSIAQGNEAGHFAVFPDGQLYINATLNRRHTAYYRLGVTATDQLHSASTTVIIYITTANKNTPVFVNQTYSFSLLSNLPVGGFVGRVEAVDKDLGLNGEVQYSLLENKEGVFSVDEKTGIIRLTRKLEKNDLRQLKSGFSLEVLAKDRARFNKRSATATVIISVADSANGSWPMFAQQVYEQSISENMPSGQLVTQVAVQDADAFVKGQIAYSIRCPSCAEVFTVDEMTGVIRLNQTLNYETRSRYDLLVLVTDRSVNHTSHKTSSAFCIVNVINENDEMPRFLVETYSVKVQENSPAGTMIIQTIAMDADSMQTEIGYEIIDGNADKIFRISRSGQIYLVYPLDYEKTKSHSLTVKAFKISIPDHFSTVSVYVEVEDCNDHTPQFSAFIKSTVRIPENVSPGSVVATTLAHDQDAGINGEIRYSILYAEPVNGHFKINEVTGQITTCMALDREVYKSYRLVLQAVDQAEDNNARQSSEKAITILLDDNNDNSPTFVVPRSVIVPEYANSGYRLLTVSAIDADYESNGHVTYDLTRTADMERFHLDRYDGHVYLRGDLQQIAPHYTLSILARDQSDDGSKQSAVMNVDLVIASRFEAENSLAFSQTVYEWTVHENIPGGSHIGTIAASLSASSTIQPVEYFLTLVTGQNGDVIACPFDIDVHSGAISLRGPALDADQGPDEFLIQVYAGIKRRTSYQVTAGQVRLKVLSVNDNAPVFTSLFYRFHLETNAPPGARIGQVAATDLDKTDIITFSLASPNIKKSFTISESTGELFLKSHPGNVSRVCFNIMADDSSHQTKVPCCVEIDNPSRLTPQFVMDHYDFTVVLDDMEEAEQIGSVTATGAAETYEYYQSDDWHNDNFHVDRRTGDIFLSRPRVYPNTQEQRTIVVLRISSSPVKQPSMLNSTLVFITLLRSSFTNQSLSPVSTSVSEDSPVGTCFHDLSELKIATSQEKGVWTVHGDALGWFTINPTGLLCTASKLDREASADTSLTTIFQAGIFTARRLVEVLIEDVNDEAPVFDNILPAQIAISSDLEIGTEILHVRATDADTGMGGEVQYSLNSKENEFSIDAFTGVIRLNEDLKTSKKTKFDLIMVAQDKGSPSLTSTALCTVVVKKANYNGPRFSASQYVYDVPEDIAIGQKIAAISATDVDSGINGDLRYWILSGNQEEVFELDTANGHLYVVRSLDYETTQSYELEVLVEDGGSPSKNETAVLTINVQNVNDEPPYFLVNNYSVSVLENFFLNQSSTLILQVQAMDADAAPFNRIKYKMRSGDASIFQIGEDDGWISLLRPLDREEQENYQVEIEASNEDFSATSTAFVEVIVIDENDVPPIFLGNLTFEIKENCKIGSLIGHLNATDVDKNSTLRYSLVTSAPFAVDAKSGRIATISSLDREQRAKYELVVRVDDGEQITFANATVLILDEDDNFPVFAEKSVIRRIPSTATSGFFVYGAVAHDRDEAGSHPIKYRFVGPESDSSWLSIDRTTGVVLVVSATNTPSVPAHFIVQAEDQAGHITTMSLEVHPKATASFPSFEMEPTSITVSELLTSGVVSKPSSKPTRKTIYAIATGNNANRFAINSLSGEVSLAEVLDFESQKNHSLWVEASVIDGDDVLTYATKLEVLVKNENDNTPRFSSRLYEIEMDEEILPPVKLQLKINAVDLDDNKLTYKLLNGTDLFSINGNTGDISTVALLDREVAEVVSVQIAVTDGVFTDTAHVRIHLLDKNDSPSKFSRQFAANVTENTAVGTFVMQVFSVDADSPNKTQIEFSLVDRTNLFTIDQQSGVIRVAGLIDREEYAEVLLEVIVRDGSWQSKSQIVVTVFGENDHEPKFEEKQYLFFVQEPGSVLSTPRLDVTQLSNKLRPSQSTLVGNVQAKDDDEDDKATEVVYTLKHPSPYFEIDRTTGQIFRKRTTDMLLEHDLELIILAREVTAMRRTAETSVRFVVLPANYTAPQLTQPLYILTVSTDSLLPNSTVMQVPVRHSDIPRIKPKFTVASTNCTECFVLHAATGLLKTMSHTDNCTTGYFCQMKVAAMYTEKLTSTTSVVHIRVTSQPTEAPRFSAEQYEVQIPESAALGTVLFTAQLDNADVFEPGHIEFLLLNDTNVFQIDSLTGNVKLKRQLDYEETRRYFSTVRARSYSLIGDVTATTEYVVTVLNENDCAPEFAQEVYTALIEESDKIGQNILTVHAVDPDAEESPVYYTIEPESPYFEIDSTKGIITNTKELDYEAVANHTFTVRVLDVADPSLFSEAQVVVIVEGMDEHSPVCSGDSFMFSVSANAPADTKIGKVLGTDRDEGTDGVVLYSLVESNSGFSINATTGEIILLRQLTLPPGTEHRLHTLIRNPSGDQKLAICEVVIHVVDGKNTPHFVQREYYARVKENVRIGSQIVAVDAITELKDKLRYSIRAGDERGQFSIDSRTGQILIARTLDRETKAEYRLEVMAFVFDGEKELSSTTIVHISVDDVNDNAPYFLPSNPVGYVKENSYYETAVLKLNTSDDDIGPSFFSYRLASSEWKEYFRVHPSTGVVTALKSLDREKSPEVLLKIAVTDNGSPPQTALLDVKIVVDDVNDSPSKARPLTIVVYVEEYSATRSRRLGSVKPLDADETGNYHCQITSGNKHIFSLSEECNLVAFEMDPGDLYRLEIEGSDGKHESVRYEVVVKPEIVTKRQHDNSLSVLITGMSKETLVEQHYVRFMQTLYEIFVEKGQVSIIGLTNIGSDCVLQISVTKNSEQLLKDEIKNEMQHRLKDIKRKSGVVVTDVDYRPCAYTTCAAPSICRDFVQPVPQESSGVSSSSLIVVSLAFEYSHRCYCPEPLSGPQCELRCRPGYCQNGGTCSGNDVCSCPDGLYGSQCQFDLDECNLWGTPNCLNGGKCVNIFGSFYCQCAPGFGGKKCEQGKTCVGSSCNETAAKSYGFSAGSFMEVTPVKLENLHITLVLSTRSADSPLIYSQSVGKSGATCFLSLEIKKGLLYLSFGSSSRDTTRITVNKFVSDGHYYHVVITKQDSIGSLSVTDCTDDACNECQAGDESCSTTAVGMIKRMSLDETSVLIGNHLKKDEKRLFSGCIRNLTINGGPPSTTQIKSFYGVTDDFCPFSIGEVSVKAETKIGASVDNILIAVLVIVLLILVLLAAVFYWKFKRNKSSKRTVRTTSRICPPYLSPINFFEQPCVADHYAGQYGSNKTHAASSSYNRGSRYDNYCMYHAEPQGDEAHYYCVLPDRRDNTVAGRQRPTSHYASIDVYGSQPNYVNDKAGAVPMIYRPNNRHTIMSPAAISEGSASTQPVDMCSVVSSGSSNCRHASTDIFESTAICDDVSEGQCSDCENCKLRAHYDIQTWSEVPRYREQATYAEVGETVLESHEGPLRYVMV